MLQIHKQVTTKSTGKRMLKVSKFFFNYKKNQPFYIMHYRLFFSLPFHTVHGVHLATWCEELTHWKRPWWWERLRARGEGATENEMVGWHHQLNRHEFEQTPGDGEGQGIVVWCSSWDHKEPKELDTTEWLTTAVLKIYSQEKFHYYVW